ncbi:MAG: MFS transporter, partial [Candidatus Competibacter phosphatis]
MPSDSIHRSARDILRVFFSGRMLTALLMGFSSGLPLLLATGSVLQAWLTEAGVDLGTIGLFALIGLPYTLKFLWAPLLDRFAPIAGMGRRRGWLLLIQITLIAAIAGLGLTDPTRSLPLVTLAAFLVSFFSASQDIVIDAYRRESLSDDEQGLGASLYVNGYRVGLLISSGGGLILADLIPFSAVYGVMAAAMLPGLITTLLCVEPRVATGTPRTLREAVVQPFVEYFSRHDAGLIL